MVGSYGISDVERADHYRKLRPWQITMLAELLHTLTYHSGFNAAT